MELDKFLTLGAAVCAVIVWVLQIAYRHGYLQPAEEELVEEETTVEYIDTPRQAAIAQTVSSLWGRYREWADRREEQLQERRRELLEELAASKEGRNQGGAEKAPSTPAQGSSPVLAPAPGATRLPLERLIERLNRHSDDHPHLVLFGNSGSGKTTLAQLIGALRPGELVVLDPKRPKGWEAAKWGGLPYVTRAVDGSYQPMVTALQSVVKEMDRRYAVMETQSAPFTELTVIFDEARNAISECPELGSLYKSIISIGREVGVRLIILSTNDRVKSLGLDGEGDMRDSLTRIHLGQFARAVYPEVVRYGRENHLHAVVDLEGWKPFDNSKTLSYLRQLVLEPTKAWSGVTYNCQTTEDDSLLAGLLVEANTSMAGAISGVHTASDHTSMGGIGDMEAKSSGMGSMADFASGMSREQRIELLVNLGVSSNAIVAAVGGDRNRTLAEIRTYRGEG